MEKNLFLIKFINLLEIKITINSKLFFKQFNKIKNLVCYWSDFLSYFSIFKLNTNKIEKVLALIEELIELNNLMKCLKTLVDR